MGYCSCLHQHGVANEADRQAFDFEGFAGFDHDGLVVRVFGQQLDAIGAAPKIPAAK